MTVFLIVVCALVVGALGLGVRALLVLVRKWEFERYWQAQLRSQIAPNAIRLVAFGDSVSQGVGASSPQYSLVGRMARYIKDQTGRPVRVENYSCSGATANHVIDEQIPKADLQAADIILLEIGANDTFKRTPEQYRADIQKIVVALPLRKTIIADLPYIKIRKPYQNELEAVLRDKEVARATVSDVFNGIRAAWRTTAGDFFHPNNRGYQVWFDAFRPGIDEVLGRLKL